MAGPEKIVDAGAERALDAPVPEKAAPEKGASAKAAQAKAAPAKPRAPKAAASKATAPKPRTSKPRAPKAVTAPEAPQEVLLQETPAQEAPPPEAALMPVSQAQPLSPSPEGEPSPDPEDFDQLAQKMMALQQQLRSLGVPVVILLEGWDAAGKGTLLGELLEGLDPRGYQVHVMDRPGREDRRYPPFRRYWAAMPARGNISLFVGSWYREVSNHCLADKAARKDLPRRYAQILQLESQLICNGTLLLKFFLNVSKKEQKARLKALESKKSTRWRVTKEAWEQNVRYDEMTRLYEAMMAETHREEAPWHVLPSQDKGASKVWTASVVIEAFTQAIQAYQTGERPWDVPALPRVEPVPTQPMAPLASFQTLQPLEEDYKEALDQAQKRLRKLQGELYRRQVPTVVCFEGWDAAGKGGTILRLTRGLDPRGFRVIPTAAPSPEEASHHHLWRFWRDLPQDGHVAIFDRTWYGRVLVERVEGFCTQAQWQRAYEEINQFELELARHGTMIRKFWLQLDPREQLARFQERQEDPGKQWKITQEDWRNRDKWPQYEQAVEEMLQRTHTRHAPWTVVEADDKRFARLKVLRALTLAMEQELKK